MNELEEFMESLIIAEKISNDEHQVVLMQGNNYEIRVLGVISDFHLGYSIQIDAKYRILKICLDLEENITSISYSQEKILNFKISKKFSNFLKKKFKGTLSIDVLPKMPFHILQIRGGINSMKELLANHKDIIVDFYKTIPEKKESN